MKILNTIINLLKGGNHAGRAEESAFGGDGRERRILHSIPSICERAVSDIGSIRVLARTCSDERGGDTGSLPPDPIRQESIALIAAAKKSGCFVDVAKVPGTRYTIRTDNQISEYLCRRGLRPYGRYAFGNEYVFVTDDEIAIVVGGGSR